MIDTADFSKRIQKIMDSNDLNASSFADRIEVGRSSISHILSGRNKPSLDFVMSIIEQFNEVDFNWLLYGTGTYPKYKVASTEINKNKNDTATDNGKINSSGSLEMNKTISQDLFSNVEVEEEEEERVLKKTNGSKTIQKIILLYNDGSFEYFVP
jgi:transcriptional regulator with XRE-family HTH domain